MSIHFDDHVSRCDVPGISGAASAVRRNFVPTVTLTLDSIEAIAVVVSKLQRSRQCLDLVAKVSSNLKGIVTVTFPQ